METDNSILRAANLPPQHRKPARSTAGHNSGGLRRGAMRVVDVRCLRRRGDGYQYQRHAGRGNTHVSAMSSSISELRLDCEKAADTIAKSHVEAWAGWIEYILQCLDRDAANTGRSNSYVRGLETLRNDIAVRIQTGKW